MCVKCDSDYCGGCGKPVIVENGEKDYSKLYLGPHACIIRNLYHALEGRIREESLLMLRVFEAMDCLVELNGQAIGEVKRAQELKERAKQLAVLAFVKDTSCACELGSEGPCGPGCECKCHSRPGAILPNEKRDGIQYFVTRPSDER